MKPTLRLNDNAAIAADQGATLDHVPIEPPGEWRRKALKRAAARHAKPFKSQVLVARVEPPSRTLLELNERSARPQPANVMPLKAQK